LSPAEFGSAPFASFRSIGKLSKRHATSQFVEFVEEFPGKLATNGKSIRANLFNQAICAEFRRL